MHISIVLCTYNRADSLAVTLRSLNAIHIEGLAVQLVIVDNGSRDHTEDVVAEFSQQTRLGRVDLVRESDGGLAAARNRGVKSAMGEIVVFTDDDVLAEKNFLGGHVDTLTSTGALCTGGRVLLKYPGPRPRWLSHRTEYMYGKLDCGSDDKRLFPPHSPLGPSIAFLREAFEKHGGFDETLGLRREYQQVLRGEETEFVARLYESGDEVWYAAGSTAYHCVRTDRLTKNWFLNRFESEGAQRPMGDSIQEKARKIGLLMAARGVTIGGRCLRREDLAFYGECKYRYFKARPLTTS